MDIYDEDSLTTASRLIHEASPEKRIIFIFGNQICPVQIPTLDTFHTQISEKERRFVDKSEAEDRYFDFLEASRMETSSYLPNRNMLCLMRLVRKGKVKSIITTNYDCYIKASFDRYGGTYTSVLNPCIKTSELRNTWDKDGYWSQKNIVERSIPLWKIHGDLGFVRMVDCNHIFALPKFRIKKAKFPIDQTENGHFPIFKKNGRRFPDPSLSESHGILKYKHHTDYLISRDVFKTEMDAASQELKTHLRADGTVFIVGLTCGFRFTEDIVPVLSRINISKPIIYVLTSKKRVKPGDNELIYELQRHHVPFRVVNEINNKDEIVISFEEITKRAGESGIGSEWRRWMNEGKWWVNK